MFANCVVFVWTCFLSVVCHDDTFLRGLDWVNPFLTEEEKANSKLGIELCIECPDTKVHEDLK